MTDAGRPADPRTTCAGARPYGAPQLDVPVRLNTNENSYPVPEPVVDAIGKAVAAELRDLNRYPDRDAVALRADLAGLPRPRADRRRGLGGQRLQRGPAAAAAGVRRARAARALGFTPAYSMHPLLALGTGTGWVAGRRGGDFGLTADEAVAAGPRSTSPTWSSSARRTTRPAPRSTRRWSPRCWPRRPGMVVVDEAYAEFARPGTPQRAGAAARPPAAGGHPHDEQGVRLRRRAARLPGRRPGRGRRGAAGPAAVPPLGADPGRGARGAGPRAGAAGHGRGDQGAAGPDRRRRCASWGSPGRRQRRQLRPLRRSAATRRRPGGPCSTGACWSATSACPAGCGSPPAPRTRPTRSCAAMDIGPD